MNEPIPAEASAVGVADPIDLEHLKLLSIFHFIVGAITILFSSIFIIHVVMGVMMAIDPTFFPQPKVEGQTPPEFPHWFGIFLAVFSGSFVLAGWLAARRDDDLLGAVFAAASAAAVQLDHRGNPVHVRAVRHCARRIHDRGAVARFGAAFVWRTVVGRKCLHSAPVAS